MDTIHVILLIIALVCGGGFVAWGWNRFMQRRLQALFAQTDSAADVRNCCMIREGCLEGPGVAQILHGNLCIITFFGSKMQIPLAQIRLTQIKYGSWGRSAWWGKIQFHLNAPKTDGLIIGVDKKNSEIWEKLLSASGNSLHS